MHMMETLLLDRHGLDHLENMGNMKIGYQTYRKAI